MIFYFNYAALFIFACILLGIFARGMTKGRTNKIYICMVVLSVVATLCDFLPYCFQYPLSDQTLFLANVINYGYFFSRNLCILLYILFLFSVSRTWYEVRPKKRMLIVTLPYFVIVAALVVNMFSPKLFYISQMTGYERRSMIYILYVVSGLYCILALMFLIYCRRFIVLQKWLALLSLLVLSSIAIVIQAMDERYHVEMFSMSISMLLMLLFVQKPEEQMDVHTHVFGWDAYRAELHKIEATKQKTMIGIVTFTNAEEVRAYLGDDRYNEYILNVMRKMEMNSKQVQSDNTVFFEYPGHLYVITDSQDTYGEDLLEFVYDYMLEAMRQDDQSGATLNPVYSLLKFPDKLKTADEVINFGHNHEKFFLSGEKYALAERFFERKDFPVYNHIDEILERAINNQWFEMYYQPIYDTKKKQFTSAEALIRLNDPEYGFVSPFILITTAEQRGLMNLIGEFVLDTVYKFVGSQDFKKTGFEYVEINLSIHQCMNPELSSIIFALEEKYHVDPSNINFEVTESANVEFEEIVQKNMENLTSRGYAFSLDDYGTGYSNIHRVSKMPLSIIKMDKTMIDAMGEKKGYSILKNAIRMMKDIQMEVIAEGVETKEDAEAITDLNCDYIQGFYYAKPMPKDELMEFLEENNEMCSKAM